MLYQKNPITQRDFQAAAADLMQNNPELFAQIENLRRQNRAQIQRGVAAFLTGKPQPPGVSVQAVFADNNELAKRRAELERQRNDLIKTKLKAQGATADIADDIIAGESRVFQSGFSAEASGAVAAIQAKADLTKAVMEEHSATGNKVLDLTASNAPSLQDYYQGNQAAAENRQTFMKAAQANSANPSGLASAYNQNMRALSPEQRRMQAAALKVENPDLFAAMSTATEGAIANDLAEYVVFNQVELAQKGAITERGLSLLQEIDLPPSYYEKVQVKRPDGTVVEVKQLNEKAFQTGGYSAFTPSKGKSMREMADEFKWGNYVRDILTGADKEVDPTLARINEELKNLKTTTAGVDAPTVSRATLRTDADVRDRAKEYAQARLSARKELVEKSDAGDAAKARRLGRIESQRELLAGDAPVLGARQKLATQKAQRMLRRGTRFELGAEGKYQQKSAPMSVAQQFAAMGSRAKPGALTAEMESGTTASGAQSKDYEEGGKPITAAGDSAKTGLAGLGQALVDSGTKATEEPEDAGASEPKTQTAPEEDTDTAARTASKFFGPNVYRQRLDQGLRQKLRSRRGLYDDIEGDDVDEDAAVA